MWLHVGHYLALGPLSGGVIAGVLHAVLGPDHLCTIVTLSACQGAEAFWFGVQWATGHVTGMSVVGVVFVMLNANFGDEVLESYEHYADYALGVLLILFGAYFLKNADLYFDSEWKPRKATCSCHGPSPHPVPDRHADDAEGAQGAQDQESAPLLGARGHQASGKPQLVRRVGSLFAGFVQGIACPAGVVGLLMLREYAKNALEMFLFIATFFVVTALAMGTMAMAYGVLTERCISSGSLARLIYCCSCGASLLLGTAWIGLNATGALDGLLGHDHAHGADGHSHHHHHHDHSIHDHGHTGASLLLAFAAPR